MFEKEAEETGNEKIKGSHQFARCARKSYKDGFKDGAEFGYNKANEELEEKIKVKKLEILELKSQIEKMKCLLNEIYSEYGFSELVKIRNNLPIEIQGVIKEIK